MSSPRERMYKVVMVGDSVVGKTSFILRVCRDEFKPNLNPTIGVDSQVKTFDVDGDMVALQIWDTAGQERFRSIATSYFRRSDGVILLYDVTYEASFLNVRDWITAVEDGAGKKLPIVLCGNKTDLRPTAEKYGKKVISTEAGKKLAKQEPSFSRRVRRKDPTFKKQS
ncbi:ras and EF-hand domain-containing protein homolog isoform X2 [Branchiostoma floridae x Branchiostoma japonicum]